MKKFFAAGIGLFVAVVLSGCQTEETKYEYLKFDVANLSFLGDGNAPATIKVSATGAWEAEPSASWITISEKSDDSVTVTVSDNDQENERQSSIVFTMGDAVEEIPVNQLPMEMGGYMYRYPATLDLGLVMSPNGKYVGGEDQVLQDDQTFNWQIWIFDLDTDESRMVAEFSENMYGLQQPQCITDQGLIFISDSNDGGTKGIDLDGNVIVPEKPDGFQNEPSVQGSSADGSIWVGYCRSANGDAGMYYPILWVNGKPEVLPIPDTTAHGTPQTTGVMARGCSHDGKVIYGSSWDNMENSACFWRNNGNGYEFQWAGAPDRDLQELDYVNASGEQVKVRQLSGPKLSAERTNISPNGKWLAVTWCREKYEGDGGYAETRFPAFINLETNKAYLYEDLGIGAGARHATNDGLGFTIDGLMTNSGKVVEIETGAVLGNMYDWIKDNYGIATSPGSIDYMTPDMQRFISLCLADDVATGARTTHWYVAPRPQE